MNQKAKEFLDTLTPEEREIFFEEAGIKDPEKDKHPTTKSKAEILKVIKQWAESKKLQKPNL